VTYEVNEAIRYPELRVIADGGEHFGVIPTRKALDLARERELDLVVIQSKTEPPVAKIIDFGKFKYEQDKAMKEQKAKQKTVEVKGVRLSVRIGQHDLDVRKEQAKKHLEAGNKVKVEIILRGREKSHGALGTEVIKDFIESLNTEIPLKTEQPVSRQGGQLTSIVGKA
jgi:translation initiation factor IF-3